MTEHTALTIQQVSQACGINPVTLRAWERRYQLLAPARTGKGHRRYHPEDVTRIRQIQAWLDKGVPIGQVAPLLTQPSPEPAVTASPWPALIDEGLSALQTLNGRRLEQLLNRLLRDYSHDQVIRAFTDPLQAHLAQSPLMAGRRALLDAVLMQKWSARALSLAPRRGETGWLLVPVGSPLPALELAMVMGLPLWCLQRPVEADALAVLLAERPHTGVLWVISERPSTSHSRSLWQSAPPVSACACWGPAAALVKRPAWLPLLEAPREQLAPRLQSLYQETSTQ
ncbi:MerR family transcriptional regulator [Alcanivorax hongdengensis A-11-3]|uniref:MerR family transcriptional regulator n=1 Tax=Alcanivorax hongdengensis A-11-3 TaxID=1177179 RepID=L0WB63_9GAMM|nr:MerR family transcriptional regulator [Alcanivorax hongdengensis]EKF73998.1 MerR family transcriptional regulator [Alcanivorax hongdengensis A-11-3]